MSTSRQSSPIEDIKRFTVQACLTEREFSVLDDLAQEHGLSRSAMARDMLLEGMKEYQPGRSNWVPEGELQKTIRFLEMLMKREQSQAAKEAVARERFIGTAETRDVKSMSTEEQDAMSQMMRYYGQYGMQFFDREGKPIKVDVGPTGGPVPTMAELRARKTEEKPARPKKRAGGKAKETGSEK